MRTFRSFLTIQQKDSFQHI